MYTADDATTWQLTADIVVVGSSGGGIVAALAAAQHGCRVVLHERTKEIGGSLARGSGMVPAAGTRFQRSAGVQDTAEAFASDILAQSHGANDPAVAQAVCRAAAELVEWLADGNVARLQFVPGLVARGHVAPRLHAHGSGTGAQLSADLARMATKSSHVTLRTASVVEDLWVDRAGAIVGIAAREKRGPINVAAGRVVLACGGFAANADMVREHHAALADLPYAGVPGALGDGLRWGIGCGAATSRLDRCVVTPLAVAPTGFVVPESVVRDGGVLVNQGGERFVNETDDPMRVARAMLGQPGKLGYLVFDERIYKASRDLDPHFARLIVPRAVRRGPSIADLARHFEIDAEILERTLESFHAETVHRTDPFGRAPADAALAPPFYGIRVMPARVRTLGGLRVNAHAQVVRPDGTPIENLYACGGVAVDVSEQGGEGYPLAHDVLNSLALGWIAGQSARPRPSSDAEGTETS